MAKDKTPENPRIKPIPAHDAPERIWRARRYMERQCALANKPDPADGLAESTIFRHQMASSTCESMGLPILVLIRQEDEWRLLNRDTGRITRHPAGSGHIDGGYPVTENTPSVTENPPVTENPKPKVTENAETVTKKRGRPPKAGAMTHAERQKLYRERQKAKDDE